jgi:hypothetical protein
MRRNVSHRNYVPYGWDRQTGVFGALLGRVAPLGIATGKAAPRSIRAKDMHVGRAWGGGGVGCTPRERSSGSSR